MFRNKHVYKLLQIEQNVWVKMNRVEGEGGNQSMINIWKM